MTGPRARPARLGRVPFWTGEIRKTLWKFRKEHGWEAGMAWDPYQGKYTWPPGRGKGERR